MQGKESTGTAGERDRRTSSIMSAGATINRRTKAKLMKVRRHEFPQISHHNVKENLKNCHLAQKAASGGLGVSDGVFAKKAINTGKGAHTHIQSGDADPSNF